jgi:hypothetical protein
MAAISARKNQRRKRRRAKGWGIRRNLYIGVHLLISQPPATGKLPPSAHQPTWHRSKLVRAD